MRTTRCATRLCVVDADGHETPPGVAGELTIAGADLAQGYTRAPGRTARSFCPDPRRPSPARACMQLVTSRCAARTARCCSAARTTM
ncbi:hypothetical protein DF105_06665 [Burkholderia stagnalis]|nr:hypothetical protein DF117_05955 [Burkholderia stagnalis]RQZ01504.1 hypothetical protein DF106_04325 [Burkholderia stagnalis]RQZ07081.1 hypothetical protein DF105_06665 [Burkholderia stagnalis]